MRLILATFALVLAAPVPAQDTATSEELKVVQEKVSSLFQEIKPEHIFPSPIDGWYTIRKGAIVAYISSDGRYLLQGDVIDLDQQVNLSELERNEARIDMMAAIPDSETIIFSPDEVLHRVSVFTDVDCTYCRRLHSQIDEYLEKGIEVRYLLYPRNGPLSESWATAQNVWCAKDRNAALTAAKLDQRFETSTCDSAVVSEHFAVGQDVGLRGTPAIVLDDGRLVSGYLPPDQLALRLAAGGSKQ